jgi:hypothetical protein
MQDEDVLANLDVYKWCSWWNQNNDRYRYGCRYLAHVQPSQQSHSLTFRVKEEVYVT